MSAVLKLKSHGRRQMFLLRHRQDLIVVSKLQQFRKQALRLLLPVTAGERARSDVRLRRESGMGFPLANMRKNRLERRKP